MAKLKKSGIKGLERSDIEPVHGRAWVDLSALNSAGQKEIIQRCKVQQFFPEIVELEIDPTDKKAAKKDKKKDKNKDAGEE